MLKVLVRLTGSADTDSLMTTASSGLTVPVFLNRLVSEILTSAAREGGHGTSTFFFACAAIARFFNSLLNMFLISRALL